MTDLRKAAEMALEALEDVFGLEKKDVAAIQALRQALAQEEKPPVKSYCGGKPNYCTPEVTGEVTGDVDETAKGEHEPWPSVQCVCGGTIYFKYTPPVSDYHEGWEEGFKAGKREWVGLTVNEAQKFYEKYTDREELIYAIDKFLEEKNG